MGDVDRYVKRVERRLPSLLVTDDALGIGRDIMDYRLEQFKRANPSRYNQHKVVITKNILDLKLDVDSFWKTRKKP